MVIVSSTITLGSLSRGDPVRSGVRVEAWPKGAFERRKSNAAAANKAKLPHSSAELLEQLTHWPVTPKQFEDIFARFKQAFF